MTYHHPHHHHRRFHHTSGIFYFAVASLVITCFVLWKIGLFSTPADNGLGGANIQHINSLEEQLQAPEQEP